MCSSPTVVAAGLLGAATGLRSMTGIGALTQAARAGSLNVPFAWIGSHRTASGLAFAAVSEYVADKLPFVPSRTSAGALGGRMLFGAICGALVAVARKEPIAEAVAIGAASATAAAFAGFHLRRRITQSGTPDFLVALAEDGIAAALAYGGTVAASRRSR